MFRNAAKFAIHPDDERAVLFVSCPTQRNENKAPLFASREIEKKNNNFEASDNRRARFTKPTERNRGQPRTNIPAAHTWMMTKEKTKNPENPKGDQEEKGSSPLRKRRPTGGPSTWKKV